MKKQAEGCYQITSVCKDDLRDTFRDNPKALKRINEMTENEMATLASKMADSYIEDCYWSDLKIIFKGIFLENETE